MKALLLLVLGIILTSCSGYFSDIADPRSKDPVHSLALADGSGYISTDDHNEITPFIFKDTNTGKKWLFFASDRGGSYDIYYAEMDNSGKFSHPVKMDDTNINTLNDDYSPVVFMAQYNGGLDTGLYVSFLHDTGAGTNVETYKLNPDFTYSSYIGSIPGDNAARISLMNKNTLYPSLLLANGNNYWTEYTWNSTSAIWDYAYPYQNSLNNMSDPVLSADGFQTGDMYEGATWYIFCAQMNGRLQIFAGGLTNDNYSTSEKYFHVFPYISVYNDKDPFVDLDDAKVYFSSDRYGKGNFDLYRYNDLRFYTVFGFFLSKPELTLDTAFPDPLQFSWQPVPGATHYKIFLQGEGFQEIADITGTNYIDYNASYGNTYYYGVVALNNDGSSAMVTLFVNYGGGQIAAGQTFRTMRGR